MSDRPLILCGTNRDWKPTYVFYVHTKGKPQQHVSPSLTLAPNPLVYSSLLRVVITQPRAKHNKHFSSLPSQYPASGSPPPPAAMTSISFEEDEEESMVDFTCSFTCSSLSLAVAVVALLVAFAVDCCFCYSSYKMDNKRVVLS